MWDRDDCSFSKILHQHQLVFLFLFPRLTFLDPGLESALGSIECNAVAFVGRVGGQGIAHLHLVFVADLYGHLVVAVDFFTKDASIPVVAIVFFILHIQLVEVLIFGDVPVKITGRCMRAASAGFGTEGPIFPIKLKRTECKYLLRIRV